MTVTQATGFARYSITSGHNPHEIVMLRGSGCKWRKCRFCDYHLDYSKSEDEAFELNKKVLDCVEGKYPLLEVINSGSFCDLDERTIEYIIKTAKDKDVKELSFECHWIHRDLIDSFKKRIQEAGLSVRIKMGVETFDEPFRESYLVKGMPGVTAEDIAKYADDVCLLQGIPGQSAESMISDIETALKYFKRACVNIMTKNSAKIVPDERVKKIFVEKVYPLYLDNPRLDILLENGDWGLSKPTENGKISAK